MPAMTLLQQAKEYGDFYVPRFEVTAAGLAANNGVIRDITQVTYRDNIKEIDSFEFTVGNWDAAQRRLKYVGSETTQSLSAGSPDAQRYKLFEPGMHDFQLRLGYGSNLTAMTLGYVTTLEPTFPTDGPPTLTVRALNVLHRLRDKKRSQHWTNKRESDIAKSIKTLNDPATQRHVTVRISDQALSQEQPIEYVAQETQYDLDFLLARATLAGYVVCVDIDASSGTEPQQFLYFGPSEGRSPGRSDVTYELEWGRSLMDFKPVLATARQVASVTVKSWDRQKNKSIVGKAAMADVQVNTDLTSMLTNPGLPTREEVITNEPQPTQERADRRARAVLSDRLKEFVTAHGTTIGLPELRAGQRVQIKGVGARFSGIYFVTDSTHSINDSGYTTTFTARRERALPGATS